ncbi:hypothetical protein MSAN_01239700 [Mycena sanguinolenta]|uniref:F-box domain-containing protein n=1 Tax=Mycena sanguinolenta TaxID=230812 RepID=A0A8H7D4F1_9AGAR|nr:hypothetical protein MSAN_01239700 [Mycena sanguinolenta]
MTLNDLPDEIIYEIMELVPPSDQAALCGTSQRLHILGVPVLYRVVALSERAPIEAFCATVLSNLPKFAELVRSFEVIAGYRVSSMLDNSPALADTCKALQRIETLALDSFLHNTCWRMQAGTFPHLVSCTLSTVEGGRWASTAHADRIAAFLGRHLALECIWIGNHPNFEVWPAAATRIPMRSLRRLRAPPKFLACIAEARLKEVRMEWSSAFEQVGATFTTLRELAADGVPFTCAVECWAEQVEEIADAVSKHMPQTRTLHMVLQTLQQLRDIMPCLARCLPSLTDLTFLSLVNVMPDHRTLFSSNVQAFQTKALVEVCPTLQACRFNNAAWRKVGGDVGGISRE